MSIRLYFPEGFTEMRYVIDFYCLNVEGKKLTHLRKIDSSSFTYCSRHPLAAASGKLGKKQEQKSGKTLMFHLYFLLLFFIKQGTKARNNQKEKAT